jgi:D-threo-aldose 1-dehydrogenase
MIAESQLLIGTAQVRLSALGFGAAPIGNLFSKVAEDDAQATLEEAFTRGICYFDTAPFYGHGLSEQRLGRALGGRPRRTFVVSTKVGRRIESDEQRKTAFSDGFAVTGTRAFFDYSRDGVQRSVESSLRRLGIDRIDVLLLHDVGRRTHGDRHAEFLKQALDEALPTMAGLRDAGIVDAVGVGVNEQEVCLELMPRFDLDCILLAGRYTLLEQYDSIDVMAEAQRRGVRIIAAGPYSTGLLGNSSGPGVTYNYEQPDAAILQRVRNIYRQCAAEGVDAGAAALQLPLAHPAVASVVAGLRSVDEVISAVERLAAPIPDSLWARLKQTGLIEPGTPVPCA